MCIIIGVPGFFSDTSENENELKQGELSLYLTVCVLVFKIFSPNKEFLSFLCINMLYMFKTISIVYPSFKG